MKFSSSFLLLVSTLSGALALYSPPRGAITVGTHGKYSTISAALNDTSSNVYFIYAGTYAEQVYITRPNITVYGQTLVEFSYLGNEVLITAGVPASVAGSNDASGTVRIGTKATGAKLYNLNIANTYGDPEYQSQAIALSIQATHFGGYGLKLTGWQDTLLANVGSEFIGYSLIEGAVDFIFGRTASLWITKSVLNAVGTGYLTASGRQTPDNYSYVIDQSFITGATNVTTYLGRPWGVLARVIFQKSYLGSVVNPAGWSIWNVGDERIANATFEEYRNFGPGAIGPRANFSHELSKPILITDVLDSTYWIDQRFL